MLRIASFDPSKLIRNSTHLGQISFLGDWAINLPACCAGFMEFDTANEQPFFFGHAEIHYVLGGTAEYVYTSQPDHNEERSEVLKAGDLCFINYGTAIRWRPIEEPFRIVFVVMPMPEVPYHPFDES
jgi:hypothetical protein